MTVNDAGDVAFAWTRWDGANDRVQGRVDLASAPLGSIRTFSGSGEGADEARSAIDETGDAIFAWTRWDGDDWRVQTVRLPAGGAPDAVVTQSASGGHASNAELAVEPNGDAAIVWTRWDAAINETQAQVRRLRAGGALSPTVTRSAAGEDASTPHLDVRSGDRIMVTWKGFDGAHWRSTYSYGAPQADVLTDPVQADNPFPQP